MKPKKRQKLCYNCEGEVDLDVIVCPFCAADLRAEKPEQQQAPLYRPVTPVRDPQPLYPQPSQVEAAPMPEEPVQQSSASEERSLLGPIVLLALGMHLLLLGLFLALFSHNGVVFLKWNARFWIAYVLVSAPMLFFGYRALSKIS